MKRVIAVYDLDPFYADRFAKVANQKEKVPFTIIAFTSVERLKAYMDENPVEILLVDADAVSYTHLERRQSVRLRFSRDRINWQWMVL